MKSILVFCALVAACGGTKDSRSSSAPGIGDEAWLVSKQTEVISIVSEEVPATWIHRIPAAELPAALSLLDSSSVVLLGNDSLASFPSIPQEIAASGDSIYLLRAYVDNDSGGHFGVFRKGAAIAVVYGHMGECGSLHKAAVVVRSRTKIERVYGGCSGTR